MGNGHSSDVARRLAIIAGCILAGLALGALMQRWGLAPW